MTLVSVWQRQGQTFRLVQIDTTRLSEHLFRDVWIRISKTGGNIYIDEYSTQLDSKTIYFVTFVSADQRQGGGDGGWGWGTCTFVVAWQLDSQSAYFATFGFVHQGQGGGGQTWTLLTSRHNSTLITPISWHSSSYFKDLGKDTIMARPKKMGTKWNIVRTLLKNQLEP